MSRRRHPWCSGPDPVGVDVGEVVVLYRCQNAGNCTRRRKRALGIWRMRKTSVATMPTAFASDLEDGFRRSIDTTSCGAVTPTASSVTALAKRVPR